MSMTDAEKLLTNKTIKFVEETADTLTLFLTDGSKVVVEAVTTYTAGGAEAVLFVTDETTGS